MTNSPAHQMLDPANLPPPPDKQVLLPTVKVTVHSDAEEGEDEEGKEGTENYEMVTVGEEKKENTRIDWDQLIDIKGIVLPLWLVGLLGLAAIMVLQELLKELKGV